MENSTTLIDNSTTLMSNGTTLVASAFVRIFGAVSYGIFSTIGLTLNIILITVFVKNRSYFEKNAFYTIAWQLIICDVLTHSMEWIVPIRITFAGYQIYGNTLLLYAPCFVDTVVYNGTLFFSFLMTINRFTVFLMPKTNRVLFQKPRIFITIGFVWISLIILIILHNIFACYKSFSETGFYYHHVCPSVEDTPTLGQITKRFFGICSTYLPVAMFIFYILMIMYIKIHTHYEIIGWRIQKRQLSNVGHDESRKRNMEFSLLAQSFVVCGFIEIQNIAFMISPNIPVSGEGSFIVNIVGNWVSLLLSSIHPIVLFTFNSSIRNGLKVLFNKRTARIGDQHLSSSMAPRSSVVSSQSMRHS